MSPAKRTVATAATAVTISAAVRLQPLDLVPVQAALQTFALLEADLGLHLIERDEAIRAALCTLIAGQNMVLIGPPGTAKSYLVFLLAQSLGLTRFLQLMTRFTVPEELLGSISVQGMKNDNYYRITTNRLPEAQIVVLDEPFKASSAILNVMLSIINERVFDNGGRRIDVPMISLYGASNELPQGAELSALWDRFTVRVAVDYVSKAAFPRLIQLAADRPSSGMLRVARNNKAHTLALPPPKIVLQPAALFAVITAAAHMPIPQDVRDAVNKLYAHADKGIIISDRRWEQSLDLLRAHAVLEQRPTVDPDDLHILKHAFWNNHEQRATIAQLVAALANPINVSAFELADQAQSVYEGVMAAQHSGDPNLSSSKVVIEGNDKLREIRKKLRQLLDQARAEGRKTERILKIGQRVREMNEDVAALILGAPSEEVF
jgi:MoxR-like ATPase